MESGQRIRVRKFLVTGEVYGRFRLTTSMGQLRGSVVTIYKVVKEEGRDDTFIIKEDGGINRWTSEMFVSPKDIDDEKTPCVIIHVNKSTFLVIDESAIREISRVDDINQLDENILARSKFFMSEKEGR